MHYAVNGFIVENNDCHLTLILKTESTKYYFASDLNSFDDSLLSNKYGLRQLVTTRISSNNISAKFFASGLSINIME